MNYTQFAQEQLVDATAQYVAARAKGLEGGFITEPRIWYLRTNPNGQVLKTDMGPKLAPLFDSQAGKERIGQVNATMFESGLIDAVLMVIEAFTISRDKGYDGDERPSEAADRVDTIIATLITQTSVTMFMQKFRDGRPDGEVIPFGTRDGEQMQSIFAPHLEPVEK